MRRLQVAGERELAFFPGCAKGGIYAGFDYTSESGSRAAPLSFLPCDASAAASSIHLQQAHLLQPLSQPHVQDLDMMEMQQPDDWKLQAQLQHPNTHHTWPQPPGRQPEPDRWYQPHDQPPSQPHHANHTSPHAHVHSPHSQGSQEQQPHVLRPLGHIADVREPQDAAQPDRPVISMPWQHCLDYCNGGPGFYHSGSSGLAAASPPGMHGGLLRCVENGASREDVQVLAYFDDFPGVPAAVRCRVGSGSAVLCATHPELAVHWLLPACCCPKQLLEVEASAAAAGHGHADHSTQEPNLPGKPLLSSSRLSA